MSEKSSINLDKNKNLETTYFAFGCFWGKEFLMQNTEGVVATRVGYTGGLTDFPSYIEVCSKKTGHAETVEVIYDQEVVSFSDLVEIFFRNHNTNSSKRQGENNSGNYRSAIFYTTQKQKQEAERIIELLKNKGHKVLTQVAPIGPFFEADERHQNYCKRTGNVPKEKNYLIQEI